MSLLRYQRTGGHAPANDELLEIDTDGAFSLRRVVGGARVGEFAGNVPASALKTIKKHLADPLMASGDPPESQMPPVVVEYITSEGLAAEVSPEARIKNKPLASVVRVLRALAEDLTSHPQTALECSLSKDAKTVRLQAIGEGPASIQDATLTFDLFGEHEEFLRAGNLESPLPRSGPVELQPGWSVEITLPAELEFTPKKTLQLRLFCRLKYSDGIWRNAQCTAVAGKGWT